MFIQWHKFLFASISIQNKSIGATKLFAQHSKILKVVHPTITYSVIELWIWTQIKNSIQVIISRHTKKFNNLYRRQHKHNNNECKHNFYILYMHTFTILAYKKQCQLMCSYIVCWECTIESKIIKMKQILSNT